MAGSSAQIAALSVDACAASSRSGTHEVTRAECRNAVSTLSSHNLWMPAFGGASDWPHLPRIASVYPQLHRWTGAQSQNISTALFFSHDSPWEKHVGGVV